MHAHAEIISTHARIPTTQELINSDALKDQSSFFQMLRDSQPSQTKYNSQVDPEDYGSNGRSTTATK